MDRISEYLNLTISNGAHKTSIKMPHPLLNHFNFPFPTPRFIIQTFVMLEGKSRQAARLWGHRPMREREN